MKIIFSEKCLGYDAPSHPESSARVRRTYEFLKNFSGLEFAEPKPCTREDLLAVHSKALVDEIKHGKFFNPETPALPGIYNHAKLAAGAAITAAGIALKEGAAFSLMRPPGHHASKAKSEGFCYFNNLAVAVTKMLERNGKMKIAILDIDVHHCNGTQDIFLGENNVIVASLHQFGDFYPGTGKHSEANCYNYPLDAGTEETLYLEKLGAAIEIIKSFRPDLIAVSAGFDTVDGDPIGGLKLKVATYSKIAKAISELNIPRFAVLEGGYGEKLPECVYAFLRNF